MNLKESDPPLDQSVFEQLKLVELQLRQSLRQRVHNFHIQILDDGLVLEGHTKTYFAKQEVQHAVMNATKLPIRANNIVVG